MPRSKQEMAELTEQLVRDYQAGATLKQLENRYDVAASHVGRVLKRAGVQLRLPGNATLERRHAWGRLGLSEEQAHEYRRRLAEHGPGS